MRFGALVIHWATREIQCIGLAGGGGVPEPTLRSLAALERRYASNPDVSVKPFVFHADNTQLAVWSSLQDLRTANDV